MHALEYIGRRIGAELVAAAQSARAPAPPPPAVRAVCDPNGRRWQVEGPGWTMAPIGTVSAAEARDICTATALALASIPARGEE